MAFLESPRLNTKITQGAKSTVCGSRIKTYTRSGKLNQDFAWAIAKHKMDLSHGVRSRADYQTVLDLFYVVMFTPYQGFRVKDWRDFKATRLNSAVADLGAGNWQLQRKHTAGAVSFLRDIKKPVIGTVVIYDAGGSILTATVDYTTGIAAVTGTPAAWTGEFDLPMTFVDDEWAADLEIANDDTAWVTSNPIMLEELKL